MIEKSSIVVRGLAKALVRVERTVKLQYLQPPLGEFTCQQLSNLFVESSVSMRVVYVGFYILHNTDM